MSKNFEIINLYDACTIMLKMKGNKYEFNREIAKIKREIECNYNDITEEIELIKKEFTEITLEYCTKDKDGKPIFVEMKDNEGKVIGKMYDGLLYGEKPEYDKRIKELGESKKMLLRKDSGVDLEYLDIKIRKSDLPLKNDSFDGELQAQIQMYIED